MINKRKSVSDEIVKFAKQKGLIDKQNNISSNGARIIASHFSKKFENDLKETKRIVKNMIENHKENVE